MKTFMIVRAVLHDRERFIEEYAQYAAPLVTQFGGRYILRSPKTVVLEGIQDTNNSVVISEWPSMEKAQEFWNSEEYQQLKKERETLADCYVILVQAEK